MAIQDELIETAFQDEYNRLKQNGLESLLAQRIDLVFYKLFRSGYIRGHSQRSPAITLTASRFIPCASYRS
jgi:hypothetical protein